MTKSAQYSVVSLLLLIYLNTGHTWTIGKKGRTNGIPIHTTYFLTPNNELLNITAKAYAGVLASGSCQYSAIYDIGQEKLKSGDSIAIDGIALREIIGSQYNCLSLFYFSKQRVMESFILFFDGINFFTTYPLTSQVIIARFKNLNHDALGHINLLEIEKSNHLIPASFYSV